MGVIGYYPLDTAELFSISPRSVSRLQGSQRVLLRMLLIFWWFGNLLAGVVQTVTLPNLYMRISHTLKRIISLLYPPISTPFLIMCMSIHSHFPGRSFHKGDIVSSSRVIVGVDAAIADAASLALMVESVGLGTDQWKDAVKRWALVDLLLCNRLHL
jgi:hypothetical protein